MSSPASFRWPDWYLVGAPRCGTTSLFTTLSHHPQLYTPAHKEPHFFGRDLSVQPHTVRDEALYLSLFEGARAEQRVGEGSVWYLHSQRAAQEIAARRPDARILILLRDPVEMVRSLHALFLRTGNEDLPDLGDALDAMPARREGRALPEACYFPEGLQYTAVARWAEGIRRYRELFGEDQVLLLRLDELKEAPAQTCRRVHRFLGVDEDAPPLSPASLRARHVEQLRRMRPRAPWLFKLMRTRGRSHGGPKPSLPEATRRRLQAELEEASVEFARLFDAPLG
ncbi:MAG: sulfotransferase [Alphaproteobacteria bacterium]|nr:sulfotransferase [Alphaproteobacteria bacterium]